MSAYSNADDDIATLIRYVGSHLIVRQLQSVLKAEGQPTSGLKLPLQRRLIGYIEKLKEREDIEGIKRVKHLIFSPEGSSALNRTAPSPANSSHNYASPSASRMPQPVFSSGSYAARSDGLTRINFKESPLYTIQESLSSVEKCPVMSNNRHQVKAVVALDAKQVALLTIENSPYRCMVYCAAVDPLTKVTKDTEIAFPHSVELRVNDIQITGLNLRGLKNRPGSTRPADITKYLNKTPGYRNEVGLTYALTQKSFAYIVNLVKTETPDELVKRLSDGKSIAKETVITDMINKKNEDAELVATSTIMSLKCPLSTLRISLPIRSLFCNHMQCFDALSFLQLQQQAPTWTCPTCNKSISFSTLVVDRYFEDILKHTPKTVDSVIIDAVGRWSVAKETSKSPMPESSDGEDDKDIVEISATRPALLPNGEARSTPRSTPPAFAAGRETSIGGRTGSVTNKRAASQVIDLTLSDDDDPPRPSKRTNALPTPSSVSSDIPTSGCSSVELPNMGGTKSAMQSPVGTPDPSYDRPRCVYRGVRN